MHLICLSQIRKRLRQYAVLGHCIDSVPCACRKKKSAKKVETPWTSPKFAMDHMFDISTGLQCVLVCTSALTAVAPFREHHVEFGENLHCQPHTRPVRVRHTANKIFRLEDEELHLTSGTCSRRRKSNYTDLGLFDGAENPPSSLGIWTMEIYATLQKWYIFRKMAWEVQSYRIKGISSRPTGGALWLVLNARFSPSHWRITTSTDTGLIDFLLHRRCYQTECPG